MLTRKLRFGTLSTALTIFSQLFVTISAENVKIGVVTDETKQFHVLAAAVDAALVGINDSPISITVAEPDEPLAISPSVCAQAEDGVVGVVAEVAEVSLGLGASAAARAGVPLLLVNSGPTNANATWEMLSMYPHPDVLIKAGVALCEAKGWKGAIVLHEGSSRAAGLMAPESEFLELQARRLPPEKDTALLRNLLLVLKKSGATKFIVWCSPTCTLRVFDEAQRVGLMSERHSYIVLTLDLHTQLLSNFSHGGANITSLRLYNLTSPEVNQTMEAWREKYAERFQKEPDSELPEAEQVLEQLPTSLLLAYDAANITARALQLLEFDRATYLSEPSAGKCADGVGAFHADTLLNYIRSEEWEHGEDRVTSWEADGARREVELHVVELARGGRLAAAGRWSEHAGVSWQHEAVPVAPLPREDMTNRTFRILIALNKPYIMRQESLDRLSGNNQYEGFCIELIERLSQLLNFNYTFEVQENGQYGVKNNVTGEWDGMIGRLRTDKSIHFAITDLTITAERENAVDFTTPFMNLGIGILFRTPKPPEPQTFAFLLPFSNGVWVCLGLSYLGTSLVLYVVGRLCPEEWQNPYPCIDDPPALENQFTLANALWFNLGAVLLQGSEIAPVAYGTRAVAGVWWLFALVITSSYTANLATLLAKKSSSEIIHGIKDLVDNELGIKYGAKEGGSTYTFFQHATNPDYKKMYEVMKNEQMPKSNEAGIKKVVDEDYAFFMESTTIDYTVERNCNVTKVGSTLDSKGYGIAMIKGSPYRQALNLALLNLQEAGILREMQHKWWKEKHGGGACETDEGRESTELEMKNFLGLFFVLIVGCAIGIVGSCLDLAWAARRRSCDPPRPYSARLWSELRFVFRFEQSAKPLQGPLSIHSSSPEPLMSDEIREEESEPARSPSRRSSSWSRRRSSIHRASLRLARHTQASSRRSSPSPALRSS